MYHTHTYSFNKGVIFNPKLAVFELSSMLPFLLQLHVLCLQLHKVLELLVF